MSQSDRIFLLCLIVLGLFFVGCTVFTTAQTVCSQGFCWRE